ncbi:Dihydropteroate synthase [Phycisphaerae bacterium RAS1]|nr:Dihydropteroate synthase [Phycisphaerae bacterium RAS1]
MARRPASPAACDTIIAVTRILGILNLTHDSFSDGGRCLAPAAALEHAAGLRRDGADIIDVGAESTHPDSEDVSADEELRRLEPVVGALLAEAATVSIDTSKPAVMRRMAALGATWLNDVNGFRAAGAIDAAAECRANLIVMHSVWSDMDKASSSPRARRAASDPTVIVDRILEFFDERVTTLQRAGVACDRIVLDPGMGFFLGDSPVASLNVLAGIPRLLEFGFPLCVCTSRKSFIGAVLATDGAPQPVSQRGAGTLATEMWCIQHGVAFIRTHDVRPLRLALRMFAAIRAAADPSGLPPAK